ncbi:hypothetical protein CHLNCDRAFT_139492 [Chlorella variabilis]|uniref:PIK-related kinase FAT domain-containing protein n=1 Tax=Chlorella variabilis TaxID=554065 RepID=E1ZQ98_CHLVA|nr:hypothetical protein CHLNCDRAFT_139492 [Chlorella variabilis]EFN51985.1 hypothetical protein CHLNCDRAFT_139492 [Chlorella variabilis]|eukprot:XP_005844087.1 hypothetical protein CHLNCDRAFT_139492 [Chlorella variabilis]
MQRTEPVPDGVEGLQSLALQGRWREVAKRCASTTATDTAAALTVAAYHTLAFLKLKMLDHAAAELSKLGRFNDGAYMSKGQSLVPFALRIMAAEVPWRLGRQQQAVDRLYALLDWCAARQAEAVSKGGAAGDATALPASSNHLHQLWQRRHRDTLLALVNKHCQLRQYVPALSLLNQLLRADVSDAEAWAEAGTVQAMLGDLSTAQHTLKHAEQLLLAGRGGGTAGEQDAAHQRQWRQLLVHRNRGLLSFLQRDYRGAANEFAAALAVDPADAAATSNHAASCTAAS